MLLLTSSNLLNEDTYRSVCVGNHPSKQIEQGAHYIILNLLNEESVSGESSGRVWGHVQTIFGKINVIMTLRGGGEGGEGVACDANFFVCVLLSFC